jgi:hypothetical protein
MKEGVLMSNSTDTTGCISHRRHTRFFVMYEDFLDVAKVSEHQYKLAAFWRVLETKTNDRLNSIPEIVEDCKKKGVPIPEEHLWIEIPYSEFANRSLQTFKRSAFQIAAAESEQLGFSNSRQRKRPINPNDPNSPMEDYKEYLFLTDVMQSVLNGGEYPTPVEINSPLLKSIAARKKAKKEKTPVEINTPPVEINSPPTETPVEINSPPLLKSTGNKYISKDSNNDRKNECVPSEKSEPQEDSLTHSLTQSSLSSSQETPPQETEKPSLQEKPSSEIARVKGYWRQLGYRDEKSAAWAELAQELKTFEKFKSLFDFTDKQLQQDTKFKNKGVHPGNMLNFINEWKQEERRKQEQEQLAQNSPKKAKQKITKEYLETVGY